MDATTTSRRFQRLPAAFQTGFTTTPRATTALAAAGAQPMKATAIHPKQHAILPQSRPFPLAATRPRLPSAFPGIARLPNKFNPYEQAPRHPKPTCSYPVLIGMALFNNGNVPLPVGDIYAYIERRFPFYKTSGTTGWKNSVRHSLSLGQYFRKATPGGGGVASKKGNLWEILPDKVEALRTEVGSFLAFSTHGQQQLINGTNHSPHAGRPTLSVHPPQRAEASFRLPLRATAAQLPLHNQPSLKYTPTDLPATYLTLQQHNGDLSTTYHLGVPPSQAYSGGYTSDQLPPIDAQVAHLLSSLPTQPMMFAGTSTNEGSYSDQATNDYGLCGPEEPLSQPMITPQLSASVLPPPAPSFTDQLFNKHILDGLEELPLPPDLLLSDSELDLDFLKSVDIFWYLETDSLLGDETFEDFFLSTVIDRPQAKAKTEQHSDHTDSCDAIDLELVLQELEQANYIPITQAADPLPDFTLSSSAAQNSRKRKRQDGDNQLATADPLTLLVNSIIGKTFPETVGQTSLPPRKKSKLDV